MDSEFKFAGVQPSKYGPFARFKAKSEYRGLGVTLSVDVSLDAVNLDETETVSLIEEKSRELMYQRLPQGVSLLCQKEV